MTSIALNLKNSNTLIMLEFSNLRGVTLEAKIATKELSFIK